MMARKYLIETFGCQMNVHDSERMAGLLEQAGYEPTDEPRDADVVVINTCSVRERAEEKLYTRLGELRELAAEQGHEPIVAVAGCVAQQEGEAILKRSPGVADVIVGTQAIRRLPMLVEQAARAARGRSIDLDPYDDVTFPLGVTRRGDPVKAYVTIIEGCNEFCSFCVVPYTRGHERMRPEGRHPGGGPRGGGRAAGARCSCSARSSTTTRRPTTRRATSPGCSRRSTRCRASSGSASRARTRGTSRRGSSTAMARLPKICRHLHLPVQSGSTRVLDGDAAALHARELPRSGRRASATRCRTSRCRPT